MPPRSIIRRETMKLRLILVCAAVLLSLAASKAGSQEHVNVAIKLFQFQPKAIEIKAGTTVAWDNGDAIDHSVTAGEPGKQAAEFDSGFFNKGGHFEHLFAEPGTYSYFCRRHPNMRGKIIVSK
jgi:plastocyanin